jgi:butyryl-CoA dehydrogenase
MADSGWSEAMAELLDSRNLEFLLYELLDVESLTGYARFADHSPGTFNAALETARQLAERYFHNHYVIADRQEPSLVDGRVRLPAEVKSALGHFAEAGFTAAHHDYDRGGMQLPWCLSQACFAWFQAANIATAAYPFLTTAAGNLIEAFGDERQKATYLAPMLEGRCLATMALSEPQAGSSLGDIRTRARPREDGLYNIVGSKMWTSGGEHELAENIIHLMLVRIEGAPAGVKGLSLCIVPRRRVGADGKPKIWNNIALVGLNHKMGYRGTVNAVLNFGEDGETLGELVGEPGQGLAYMFHMMNEARIGIAMGSAALASAGYLHALDYARERKQGRHPDVRDPSAPPVAIIEHADVRRMLLQQKAVAEGGLALGLEAAVLVDRQRQDASAQVRERSRRLLDVLTPVIKAWISEQALSANYNAIQVLGGAGYTRDHPVEQLYRDNRLNPIHEGTNGIQAIDLLGRKAVMEEGAALATLLDAVEASARNAGEVPPLASWGAALSAAAERVGATTAALTELRKRSGARAFLANAHSYMELVGLTVFAWIWLRQAHRAARGLETAAGRQASFYRGKLQTCAYVFAHELPKTAWLADLLEAGDTTCLEMREAWF